MNFIHHTRSLTSSYLLRNDTISFLVSLMNTISLITLAIMGVRVRDRAPDLHWAKQISGIFQTPCAHHQPTDQNVQFFNRITPAGRRQREFGGEIPHDTQFISSGWPWPLTIIQAPAIAIQDESEKLNQRYSIEAAPEVEVSEVYKWEKTPRDTVDLDTRQPHRSTRVPRVQRNESVNQSIKLCTCRLASAWFLPEKRRVSSSVCCSHLHIF